jgi:SAM-dependent methyltransferase
MSRAEVISTIVNVSKNVDTCQAGSVADVSRLLAVAYDTSLWWGERRGMAALRRGLLGRAHGRVLEIGAGTGLNLQYYGERVTDLTLVEPEPFMHSRLRRRLEASGRRGSIEPAGAEALPFPDASFDTVVSTLVLCTVPDAAAAVAEIARVLRPGGQFLFIEHVRSGDPRLAAWQARLHGVWHAFAHGCNTDRDTRALLERSTLQVSDVTDHRWRGMPPIVAPLIQGVAIRG